MAARASCTDRTASAGPSPASLAMPTVPRRFSASAPFLGAIRCDLKSQFSLITLLLPLIHHFHQLSTSYHFAVLGGRTLIQDLTFPVNCPPSSQIVLHGLLVNLR